MKIKVDRDLCQGHNRCSALAPNLFVLDDFGYASAAGDGTVPPGSTELALLAVDNCPEFAVLVEDKDGDD
jgi:ferredoxin